MQTKTNNKDSILVVDDDQFNIEVLLVMLDTYNLIVTTDPTEVQNILAKDEVHLILLDIVMPKLSGIELAKILKSTPKTADIPILFITSKSDDQSVDEGFQAGASDYITKPFRISELRARVNTHLEMHKMLQKLKYEANFDYLSGARNRRSFFELGDKVFKTAKKNELFAIMIDIDHFKHINDTYGHNVGDIAIKSLASYIQSSITEDMLFARLGGEEFMILTEHKDSDLLYAWVNTMRIAISKLSIDANGTSINMTVSIGIAQNSEDYHTLDHFLDQADQQLYIAKESGRNNVKFRV